MHDAGAIAFSDIDNLGVPSQHTLRDRARRVTGTWMHNLTGSFVDDNDVLIDMDDVDVDAWIGFKGANRFCLLYTSDAADD